VFHDGSNDMSDDAWANNARADHLARCGGDASVYTAHSSLVTALAEIISKAVRGALKAGVEVLTDPTMLVQLPNSNDGLSADVGVLHYNGIIGSKLAIDVVVSGLFGVSSPLSPEVALRRAEKTKFDEYSSDGVKSRPDIHYIPLAVTEFGALGGHATALLAKLATQAVAFKGMHLGKLLASWPQNVSLAAHIAHADSILRGLSAAADDVEAASSAEMPSPCTKLFTRAMGRKRFRLSPLPVVFSALRGTFLCSPVFYLLDSCTT
jgi:hypothetical protein